MISLLFVVSPLLAPNAAPVNDVLLDIVAPPGCYFEHPLCRLLDFDGDQLPDFADVLRDASGGCGVEIRSGADGSLLRTILDPDPYFGQSIADAGDLDGDGSGDVIVGGSNSARVCSGRTGAVLLALPGPSSPDRYGYSVARLGDVDGDGLPDFAVGAPQRIVSGGGDHWTMITTGPGYVDIRSGANGSVLRVLHGSGIGIAFGGSVCAIGDADGDGVEDVAVSGFLEPIPMGPTSLTLFSGATGSPLWQNDEFSGVVSRLGDIDQDGRNDLLIGNRFGSRVVALSGANGSKLWIHGPRQEVWQAVDRYGTSVSAVGDLDGDGFPDVIAGAAQPSVSSTFGLYRVGPGYAEALSGRTGTCLSSIVGADWGAALGTAVSGLEDMDHDGRPELLVAEPGLARLRVFSGDSRNSSPQNYCVSVPNSSGSAARIGWSGSISIGANDLVLDVQGAVPGRPGFFLTSTSASALRLGSVADLVPSGFECLGHRQHFKIGPIAQVDAAGGAQSRFDAQNPASGPGSVTPGCTWNFQFVYRDPNGWSLQTNRSDALSVSFRP